MKSRRLLSLPFLGKMAISTLENKQKQKPTQHNSRFQLLQPMSPTRTTRWGARERGRADSSRGRRIRERDWGQLQEGREGKRRKEGAGTPFFPAHHCAAAAGAPGRPAGTMPAVGRSRRAAARSRAPKEAAGKRGAGGAAAAGTSRTGSRRSPARRPAACPPREEPHHRPAATKRVTSGFYSFFFRG